MFRKCKHDDEIIDKTIKKLVILLKCKKCKRVKKMVETNP